MRGFILVFWKGKPVVDAIIWKTQNVSFSKTNSNMIMCECSNNSTTGWPRPTLNNIWASNCVKCKLWLSNQFANKGRLLYSQITWVHPVNQSDIYIIQMCMYVSLYQHLKREANWHDMKVYSNALTKAETVSILCKISVATHSSPLHLSGSKKTRSLLTYM